MGGGGVGYQRMGPLAQEFTALNEAMGLRELTNTAELDITPEDALIVVDMQNDFFPADRLNKRGARFAVPEAQDCVPAVVQLIDTFLAAGAHVVASRDYHPVDHVSFATQGGLFPEHCVQGSEGSQFYPPVGDALTRGLRKYGPEKCVVAFKGYHEDIDSFGCLPYRDGDHVDRLCYREGAEGKGCPPEASGKGAAGCILDWTGARRFKCSALEFGGVNINAPPDILSARASTSLVDAVGHRGGRAFVCGVALDFCCLDTTINAAHTKAFKECSIVWDACRAAHGGHGGFGSGFISDPRALCEKLKANGVHVVPTISLTKTPTQDVSRIMTFGGFPQTMGPYGLRRLDVDVDVDDSAYTLTFGSDVQGETSGIVRTEEPVAPAAFTGSDGAQGKANGKATSAAARAGASSSNGGSHGQDATTTVERGDAASRVAFATPPAPALTPPPLGIKIGGVCARASAQWFCYPAGPARATDATEGDASGLVEEFLTYGGFYTPPAGGSPRGAVKVLTDRALNCDTWLRFAEQRPLAPASAAALLAADPTPHATVDPAIRGAGYTRQFWLGPDEAIPHPNAKEGKRKREFVDWPLGAFVFMKDDDVETAIYFAVAGREVMRD